MKRPARGLRAQPGAAWLMAVGAFAAAGCGGDEIEPPAAVAAESAVEYPSDLAAAGARGTVRLRILVGATGAVDSVEVAASSGHAGLDSAAAAGARRMAFEPATRNGEPVSAWVDAPVRFEPPAAAEADADDAPTPAGGTAPDSAARP